MNDKKSAKSALEKELKIVRKFLKRNNLETVINMIREADDKARGAKIKRGSVKINNGETTVASLDTVSWDSDGYFDSGSPTRLTVPAGLEGRYLLQVALRWINKNDPMAPDSYFYSFITLNEDQCPVSNDARSTANNTEAGSEGTTQHFTYETHLNAGDFVQLWLWQNFGAQKHCDVVLQMRRVGS
jgi:hypothetical protein